MSTPSEKQEEKPLTDEELDHAVGAGSRSAGAAGEAAVGAVQKQKRDAREYREETGG